MSRSGKGAAESGQKAAAKAPLCDIIVIYVQWRFPAGRRIMNRQEIIDVSKKLAAGCAKGELDVLKKFCAIDCGSRCIEGNKKVVDIICGELEKIDGISIERVFSEGYGEHIVAKLPAEGSDGKIVISAHTDTVFNIGDTAAHPYREEGDTAWGLGICDCKAGIIVAVNAVKNLQTAGLLPKKDIVFIFNCDEEIGSPSGSVIIRKEAEGADAAFVFEPAREANGFLTSRKGSCAIEIECFGKSAHTGLAYKDGRSAVLELCHRIMRLYEHNDDERGIQFNTGKLYGSDYANNVVPDHARATASVRVANKSDIDRVFEIYREVESEAPYIDGTTTTVKVTKVGTPMERTEGNVRLCNWAAALGKEMGLDLPEQSSGGSGDAAITSSMGIPSIDALGGYVNAGTHSYRENLRISSLPEKTALFSLILASADDFR